MPIFKQALPLAAAIILGSASSGRAQSAANVAVVVNEASPVSIRVGEHYVQRRSIPPTNVIRIRTATTEQISRDDYLQTIEGPVSRAISRADLHDRILYIVLAKGIPLRIAGSSGVEGTVSSVDSELTLLYRRMTGRQVPIRGPVPNPYFLDAREPADAKRFSHKEQDIYLVTRLDGFTEADAMGLIDRAQNPARTGKIVLDLKNSLIDQGGDEWLRAAAQRLEQAGLADRVILEQTSRGARNVADVLGYYSWGSNDSANHVRSYGMKFVPGAIAAAYVSTDGRTFQPPPDNWTPSAKWSDRSAWHAETPQSLAGDLIREGVTGVAGHVAEPYLQSTVRPQILFPAYISGFNLAESFYLAMPHLGWQTVVVGDPLASPFQRTALGSDALPQAVDAGTDLPPFFSNRRLAVASAVLKGVPAAAVTLLVKAESRLAKEDQAGAAGALQKATALSPSTPGLHLQLALLNDQRGEYDAALSGYRRVLTMQPANVAALNNLAYGLAVRKGNAAEALPLAVKAAGLASGDPTVLDTVGWVHHLLGNNQEAIKYLRQALNLGTRSAEIYFHAAVVHERLGARAEAESALARAVQLDAGLAERADVRELQRALRSK